MSSYAYDSTGLAAANLISDELQSVQPPSDLKRSNYNIVRVGPFFANSLEIWTGVNKTGTKLVAGTDYFLALKFVSGSIYLNKLLYGAIVWNDVNRAGNVYLHYQALGGDFAINDINTVEGVITLLNRDVRFLTYDQIDGIPAGFPVDPHAHNEDDWKDLSDVSNSLSKLADAILAGKSTTGNESYDAVYNLLVSHIQAAANAHTAQAVGLGNVPNYSVASEVDVQNASSTTFMTPFISAYQISRAIAALSIGTITTNVAGLTNQIATINNSISNIVSTYTSQANQLTTLSSTLTTYRSEVSALTIAVNSIATAASNALQNASDALTSANNAVLAVQNFETTVNNIVYARSVVYSEGAVEILLPAGSNLQVSLIGGGAGSGAYFDAFTDSVSSGQIPSNGGDSFLYYLGTRDVAIDPLPLAIAGGGKAGRNGYAGVGAVTGGNGGTAFIFRKTDIKVSELTNIVLSTDLISADPTTVGVNGLAGDTTLAENLALGVGGYSVNASNNSYGRRYGNGRNGSVRAGTGGGGAKVTTIIRNDSAKDIYLLLKVGGAGRSAISTYSVNTDTPIDALASMGAAACILV